MSIFARRRKTPAAAGTGRKEEVRETAGAGLPKHPCDNPRKLIAAGSAAHGTVHSRQGGGSATGILSFEKAADCLKVAVAPLHILQIMDFSVHQIEIDLA